MAHTKSNATYHASAAEGMHWKIMVYRAESGAVIVNAREGKLEDQGGYRTFEYQLYAARHVSDQLPRATRLTAKKIESLKSDLLKRMVEHGLVSKEENVA